MGMENELFRRFPWRMFFVGAPACVLACLMHTWRPVPVGQLPVGGGQKDKASEPNRNKISVLDARLLRSVQDRKRRSLKIHPGTTYQVYDNYLFLEKIIPARGEFQKSCPCHPYPKRQSTATNTETNHNHGRTDQYPTAISPSSSRSSASDPAE